VKKNSSPNHYLSGLTITIGVMVIVLASSCSKNRHPYITINKPANGQVFNAPDTIEIKADIYDTDAVTSEYLVVTKENATNDTIINFKDYQFTDATYHLDKSFASQPATNYKIVVSAIGHDNLAGDTIHVRTN